MPPSINRYSTQEDGDGRPTAPAHQNRSPALALRRRNNGRGSDERARLYASVRLRPLLPRHRKTAQPLPEGEAAGEGGAAAQGREPARLADRAALRVRFGELLPTAVPPALRHVAAAVPRERRAQGAAATSASCVRPLSRSCFSASPCACAASSPISGSTRSGACASPWTRRRGSR